METFHSESGGLKHNEIRDHGEDLGFGVFQTPPDETVAAVTTALEDGEVGSRRSGDRRRPAPPTTWCLSGDSVAGPGA